MSFDSQRTIFEKAGQSQVFTFWDELNDKQKSSLLSDLGKIDPSRVSNIFNVATSSSSPSVSAKVDPLPDSMLDSVIKAPKETTKKWRDLGLKLIAEGKVGVILLAGGQGTRLGSSAPKGCYDIQLPSHKSLFQLQGERIARLQKIASEFSSDQEVIIPWYVMTSEPTREATESFFKEHNYFGLDSKNVFFFNQGVLPAFTNDGKIILETKSSVSVAPDGNGGIYAALKKEGVIADLERRKIPYLHAYCVDNCLVKVADPVFIGYCVEKNADCGAKVVPKAHAHEQVGVICLRNGKPGVVEYSEIDPKVSEQTKSDGTLVYNAGNIANHFYTLDFLKHIDEIEGQLEYHIAKKKIKHVNLQSGAEVKPDSPNGIKLELFIFDVIPYAERFVVLETDRKEEFSPLKNAPGTKSDNPETSRADILAQHVRFARAAGATIEIGPGQSVDQVPVFELSPLVTYDGEGLEKFNGRVINTPFVLNNNLAGF
ncbi:UDP-N-acetylglucosamine pyrophosphorylase [Nowakowskiella sp. JEL0078]|nr:UDP-N-acetylglucosamine pyrophosphorylase [Nowakowskiella sp. JEL0078]